MSLLDWMVTPQKQFERSSELEFAEQEAIVDPTRFESRQTIQKIVVMEVDRAYNVTPHQRMGF